MVRFSLRGPTETRAWTIKKDALAPEAAGKIHTDFQKGFIRAEVIAFEDYVNLKGSANAKNEGKMRLEGKEYQVVEGDIVVFRVQRLSIIVLSYWLCSSDG